MNKVEFLLVAAYSALILGGVAAVIVPNVINLRPGDTLGKPFPESLHLIANVDGKSYFAENSTKMNFNNASQYCDQLGMKLATIESPNQARVLNDGFAEFFNGLFWTSGRDARSLRQFSWNATNAALNSSYLILGGHSVSHLTCIAYHSLPNATQVNVTDTSHLDSVSCFNELPGALCQT